MPQSRRKWIGTRWTENWTVERLRLAIIGLAALLVLIILGFFFLGRWQIRRVAKDLPARLGVQIQQTTEGFVLSKTDQGRTIFTLRAARAVTFKSGGRLQLHNVRISLYNRQDGKADTIIGDEFQYDPHDQVVQSPGEARIELHMPQNSAATSSANNTQGQVVSIVTHGLAFNQKTGIATSSGAVEFHYGDSSGQAVGAVYDSRQRHLLLQSQVALTTMVQGHPASVHAAQAVYDRTTGQVQLQQPIYTSGPQQTRAAVAIINLRSNGSAQRLQASGGVRMISGDGTTIHANSMDALLNLASRPTRARLIGGVQFARQQPDMETNGNADRSAIEFDEQGRAKTVVLDGNVHFLQSINPSKGQFQRTLSSQHLLLHLVPAKSGTTRLQEASAAGNAVFTSKSNVSGHPPQDTTLSGDTLNADFHAGNQLQHIEGAGQTKLTTVAANGNINTSAGDTLRVDFESVHAAEIGTRRTAVAAPNNQIAAGSAGPAAESIRSAIQNGHVVLQQIAKAENGSPTTRLQSQNSTATASHAQYEAATDTVTLTGQAAFRNDQVEISASRMEIHRASGDMFAAGPVQSTLLSTKKSGAVTGAGSNTGLLAGDRPVHIVADEATVKRADQTATFTGHARLWQESDTVEAPIIQVSQKRQVLLAYSDQSCTQCVHSTLSGRSGSSRTATNLLMGARAETPIGITGSQVQPSVFRILSQRLDYSQAQREATFLKNVEVFSASGRLMADRADVYLAAAIPTGVGASERQQQNSADNHKKERNNPPLSGVERIVAKGNVRIIQPGRTGVGTLIVYTASDGQFVLTGSPGNPPEIVDAERGTITGQELIFKSEQQAIVVSGRSTHVTTTETRVQKK